MKTPLAQKSPVQAIKERFDNDVERFSNLETGQQAVVDARLILDLISSLSMSLVPHAENMLDIGCGAGNNTIRIAREKVARDNGGMNCDLVDISQPMLTRAKERLDQEQTGTVSTFHGDFRTVGLPESHYDIIVAAAVLHHLRDDEDWLNGFTKIHNLLKPNGALFVSDMFFHADENVHEVMWNRYGAYLASLPGLGGDEYREKVFTYIDYEDSPRDLTFQIETLRKVGFRKIDILHKNSVFGAYVAIK